MERYHGSGAEPAFAPAPTSFVVILPNRNAAVGETPDPTLSRKEQAIRLMEKQGAVTRKDVERILGCSFFPANKVLSSLLEQDRIIKTGAARGTKYVLK